VLILWKEMLFNLTSEGENKIVCCVNKLQSIV
jgi:hypothetical protein